MALEPVELSQKVSTVTNWHTRKSSVVISSSSTSIARKIRTSLQYGERGSFIMKQNELDSYVECHNRQMSACRVYIYICTGICGLFDRSKETAGANFTG